MSYSHASCVIPDDDDPGTDGVSSIGRRGAAMGEKKDKRMTLQLIKQRLGSQFAAIGATEKKAVTEAETEESRGMEIRMTTLQ